MARRRDGIATGLGKPLAVPTIPFRRQAMSLPRNVLDAFRKLRLAGYGAKFAADYARTLDRFQDAESEGRARIRFESDPDSSLESNYDRSAYQSDSAGRKLWAELQRIEERDGWFGAIAEVRAEPADSPIRWQDGERDPAAEHVDSLWGLLGSDFGDTDPRGALPLEYRLDMMQACLARLDAIDAQRDRFDALTPVDARDVAQGLHSIVEWTPVIDEERGGIVAYFGDADDADRYVEARRRGSL